MCGIAGQVNYSGNMPDRTIFKTMSTTLSKRGPDANGEYGDTHCHLVHRRLIVIDPLGGVQPMSVKKKGCEWMIVYNGELYNTDEIRSQLCAIGYTFHGHSDTEIVLKAYIEWGEKCLDKFNGIFAFAIWEKKTGRLFAARDRLGVKPFFYFQDGDGIIFASQVNALLVHPKIPRAIDSNGIKQLLLLGPGRSCGLTCIKGIEELKPGECITVTKRGVTKRIYWHLVASSHQDDLVTTIEKTHYLITDAIKRRMISDVPLGCFLSGGLDSSIITAVVAGEYKGKNIDLNTYSVDYLDNDKYFIPNAFQPDCDNKYIEIMSRYVGSNHSSVVLDLPDVVEALYDACDARTSPGMADIDASLLLFCREIKKHDTVCLSGEGADEIFGGYPWYHNKEILFCDALPWSSSIDARSELFRTEVIGKDADEFVYNEYKKIISMCSYIDDESVYERRLREMFVLNIYGFLQTLLDRKDRMSMYNGLEVRVPFCDFRIVEYAFNMPWKFKSHNSREKGIVREAFKSELPHEIINRKKSPYPKTHNPAFMSAVTTRVMEIMKDRSSAIYNLVNVDYINSLIQKRQEISKPIYGQLMNTPQVVAYLVQLEYFIQHNKLTII
ncbi:MAG: asparagine synthase (glutamine-hydrolyzing) [Christensenellaceae bacterium]|jgi:asparagine synthase (glutamine-hydrolysing)|nr:asparagine synthase (glutamine-hydrolyzing) [Christensenellaceae bacterium]